MRNLSRNYFLSGSILLLIAVAVLFACNDPTYTPKPRGFFRIEFPDHAYKKFSGSTCPYDFEIPVYSEVKPYRDSLLQPCWKYIEIPRFNASVFISYHRVNGDIGKYLEDAHTLAYKHAVKASTIDDTPIHAGPGVSGMIYDIGGAAASPVQFFVTDSTRHFLRGALYFNTPPQPDSLAPVIAFLRKDLENLLLTTRWN